MILISFTLVLTLVLSIEENGSAYRNPSRLLNPEHAVFSVDVSDAENSLSDHGRMLQRLPEPTAIDQYTMELVNRARMNPQAEADRFLDGDLNEGLAPGTITSTPKQPLAWNLNLQKAALDHGRWLLHNNREISHRGEDGSSIFDRIERGGYEWRGSIKYGENISEDYTDRTPDYGSMAKLIHWMFFVDKPVPSRGHRRDMMRPNFREVGIANPTGPRTHARSGRTFKHGMITVEDFAVTSMADETFLTGVAYTDGIDDDDFYTIGEGLGGIIVTAVDVADSANTFSTTTMQAGGYMLRVKADSTYTVTFSGDLKNDGTTLDAVYRISIGTENYKQDLVSDQLPGVVGPSVGIWGSWSQWSVCDADCEGNQIRTRSCIGTACEGPTTESRECNGSCSTTTFTAWGEWSSCSATCGPGTQTKTRSCIGNGCVGATRQTRDCNLGECSTITGEIFKLPIASYTGSEFYDNPWGELSQCFDGEYGENRGQKGYVCHSEEIDNPWIEIVLPQVYTISSIKIWNRWKCCQERLGLHEWFVDGELCHSSVADSKFEIEDSCNARGSKIRLRLPGQSRVINLQEIEIFGTNAETSVLVTTSHVDTTSSPTAQPTQVVTTFPPTQDPTSNSVSEKECDWVSIRGSECRNACPTSMDCRRMRECADDMTDGEYCEADRLLPNGNGQYDVNNCYGMFDVFRYVCPDSEDVVPTTETFELMGFGLCRDSNNHGVKGMAHTDKTHDQCRQMCEVSEDCIGYSAQVEGSGMCYVYGDFGRHVPSGWSRVGGWDSTTEIGMSRGRVRSMTCYRLA